MTDEEKKLIGSLIRLASPENPANRDRAALAALRTGLGKRPGEAPRMFPYVSPYLKGDRGPAVEAAFLTAALFASHPENADNGSLGTALRRAVAAKHGEEGVEKRLAAALDADREDLPCHLAGLVGLCESARVPINWFGFLDDVKVLLSDWDDLNDPTRPARDAVRMKWARHFWRAAESNAPNGDIS